MRSVEAPAVYFPKLRSKLFTRSSVWVIQQGSHQCDFGANGRHSHLCQTHTVISEDHPCQETSWGSICERILSVTFTVFQFQRLEVIRDGQVTRVCFDRRGKILHVSRGYFFVN